MVNQVLNNGISIGGRPICVGFGVTAAPQIQISGEQIAIDADGVAAALNDADSVIIVRGYGTAVAQAQQ